MQYKTETNRFANSCIASLALGFMLTGIALSVYFCLPVEAVEQIPQVAQIDTIEELDEKVLDEDGHGKKFNQNKTNVQHNFNYITSRSEI